MPAVQRRCVRSLLRLISASSARLPPSPLLSARMMIMTYLSVTTIIIDQKIRLRTPRMCGRSVAQLVMAGEGLAEGVDRAACRYRRRRCRSRRWRASGCPNGGRARPHARRACGWRRYRSSVRNVNVRLPRSLRPPRSGARLSIALPRSATATSPFRPAIEPPKIRISEGRERCASACRRRSRTTNIGSA